MIYNKSPSIKKNAFLNVCRTLLSIIFPLITFPYATRVLLPEGIGKVQFSAGIISYFVMFAGLGIGTYGIRETAKKRDNIESLTKITKELFILNIIPTLLSYILFGIALFAIPKLSEYRSLLIVYSATILFTTLGVEWLYSGIEQYAYITIRQLVFQICSLIALFVFVRQKEDTLKYAAISVFSNVGANLCNCIHSRKYINWRLSVKLEILKHFKPVLVLFGMRIAASLYVALDTTLLGFLCNDTEVGYYEAANKMTRIVVSLITSVTAVMLPRLSYCFEKKEESVFRLLIQQSFNVMVLFALPMAIGLCLLSKNIILLISGINFMPAFSTMHILSPLVFIISLSSFFGNQIFLPMGKEKVSFYAMITGALVNIILSVIFIRKYGAFGAALASLIAETSIATFYFIVAIREKLFFCKVDTLLHCILGVIIMSGIVVLVNISGFTLLTRTILAIILGGVIYIIILFLVKDKTFLNLLNFLMTRIQKKK